MANLSRKQRPADPVRQAVKESFGRDNVAHITGASPRTITRWLAKGRIESADHALKLSLALSWPVNWLIEGVLAANPTPPAPP